MLRLSTRVAALGAEFFRWEFATAIAGAVLGINPFDEPNVSEAKEKTKAILADGRLQRRHAGRVRRRRVASTRRASPARRRPTSSAPRSRRCGRATTSRSSRTCRPTPASRRRSRRSAPAFARRTHVASTFGVGPRYLHSTGQYHKGGPNTAVAFVHHRRGRDGDADPGRAVLVQAAEARAGGRRLPDARSTRSPHRADPLRSRRGSGEGARDAVRVSTGRSHGYWLLVADLADGGQMRGRFDFDILVQAVAVRVHRHDRRESR